MASFLSKLFGFGSKPARQEQVPLFTPQQQQVFSDILQQASQRLQEQPRSTQDILEPVFGQARQRFQEQTIPQLLEQFNAAGQFGSGRLESALAKAGGDLESQLAALGAQAELGRAGQQQQQIQQLLGLGLTPQFQTIERQREPGFLESAAVPALQGFGQFLPLLLGGSVPGLSQVLSLLGRR